MLARSWPRPLLFCLLAGLAVLGCSGDLGNERAGPKWLVIGIDGADWRTIEGLAGEGQLPHLSSLAERGVSGILRTAYGASPVIWTSVATGVVPEVHGITGFAVPTPDGDVPVSSRVRKVPALWNMMTTAGRRSAVVSWWASWPAEPISGVVVSDRAGLGVENEVSPAALSEQFAQWREAALAETNAFDSRVSTAERDHVSAYTGRQLLDLPLDLAMVYFRGVDIASHRYWKYHQPDNFPEVTAEEIEEFGDLVASTYRATDQAIGRLLDGIGPATNVMVLSDHGFHAMKSEEVRIMLDFDRVLTRLGFQQRSEGKVDWAATELYTFATAKFRLIKRVRFAPDVPESRRQALRAELTEALGKVTFAGGEPVFSVRDAGDREVRTGADFVVDVYRQGVTKDLHYGDEVWPRMIPEISFLSGSHSRNTHGVFFAAGPDVAVDASLDGIHIHDIAPTLLYGLGLPVAEDFAGRAFTELYAASYREQRPLRTIASWGTMNTASEAPASQADEEILDDLRALGYID